MGETRIKSGETQHKIKVGGAPRTVSGRELDNLLANDPMGLVEIEGEGADAFYKNMDGDVGRGKLTAEQLRNRKSLGEENVHFGAGDPKEDVWKRDYQRRASQQMAEKYGALVAARNFVPGIQLLENAVVGIDEATKARQNLIAGSPLIHMGTQIGSFFAAGGALKMLSKGTRMASLIGAHRSTILGKTAQLAGEDALLETHLYTQHIWNNNKEFITEDWAEQVAEGLLFVAPLIGSYAARAAIGKAAQFGIEQSMKQGPVLGKSLSSVVSRAADMGVLKGLMTKAGVGQAKTMRRSAGARVFSRLLRRKKASRAVSMLDELDQAARVNADELTEIYRYTPEWFQGRRGADRLRGVQRLRELGAEPFKRLDDVNFNNVVTKARKMQNSVATLPDAVRGLNRNVKLRSDIASVVDEAMYNMKVVEAFDSIHVAGHGNISNYLENTFHLSSSKESFGKWVQARMDAKINKGPGWTVVDEKAGKFLSDRSVWDEVTAARGDKINKAIDEIAGASDEVAKFTDNFPNKFDEITTKDVDGLTHIDAQIGRIEDGYAVLEAQGVLSPEMLRSFRNKIGRVRSKLDDGKKAYFDSAQINEARKAAEVINETKRGGIEAKMPKTPEEVAALQAETAVEGASMLVAIKELAHDRLHNLRSTRGTRNATFGILALKESTTIEERDALYSEVADSLRAMVGNPMAMQEGLRDILGNVQGADPHAAMGVGQKSVATMYYLASQLPKADLSNYGHDIPVSPTVKNNFLDKLVASHEPFSVGVAAISGRVTPGMTAAILNTNPSIYAEMVTVLSEEIASLTPEQRRHAPRAAILGIESFLGGMNPAHVGMSLMQLQSTYAQTAGQNEAIQGTGSTMKSQGPQDAASDYTSTQRITGF